MKIALHGLLETFHAHAVVEHAVDDGFANPVGVLGARFDAIDVGAKGLATTAAGAVFSNFDFEYHDLAKSDIAHAAGVNILAPSGLAAVRTGKGFRSARKAFHAHARLNGIHACVPPGFCA
jgi:hypothetical protein